MYDAVAITAQYVTLFYFDHNVDHFASSTNHLRNPVVLRTRVAVVEV